MVEMSGCREIRAVPKETPTRGLGHGQSRMAFGLPRRERSTRLLRRQRTSAWRFLEQVVFNAGKSGGHGAFITMTVQALC
jgi:pilus assembly protein TadC